MKDLTNRETPKPTAQEAKKNESKIDSEQDDTVFKKIEMYKTKMRNMAVEIVKLKKECTKLQNELENSKSKLDIVMKEETRLKDLNYELQQSCINSCHEMKSIAIIIF